MHKLFYVAVLCCLNSAITTAQNVGIGIHQPLAGLHVISNNGLLVKGTIASGNTINETGAGSMLIFNTRKGAFRAGYVSGGLWSDSLTGFNSIALGNNVVANGSNSLALGYYSKASEVYSTAIGYNGTASAFNSVAISAFYANASAQSAVAIGSSTLANGYASLALGSKVTAGKAPNDGAYAVAIGNGTNQGFNYLTHFAVADRSFAFGNDCRSMGERSFAMGNDCLAGGDFETPSVGRYALAIGNSCRAIGMYSFALGNNANTNGYTGSMVLGSRIDGVAVNSPADFHFLAQFAGGYQLQSNNAGTLGVYLQPNTSSWASLCDRTKKEQVLPLNDEAILQKLANIDYYSWKYKDDPDATHRHYGIMAQDFYAAFGKDALGNIGCDTLVNPIDLLGVAYSAIKALGKRTDEIAQLKKDNAALQERLSRLEAILLKEEKR